jgi:hypothetical protein
VVGVLYSGGYFVAGTVLLLTGPCAVLAAAAAALLINQEFGFMEVSLRSSTQWWIVRTVVDNLLSGGHFA